MNKKLKYSGFHTGFSQVIFKGERDMTYCFQENEPDEFTFYRCSRDGEPQWEDDVALYDIETVTADLCVPTIRRFNKWRLAQMTPFEQGVIAHEQFMGSNPGSHTPGPWKYEHDSEENRHYVCHKDTECETTTVVEVTTWYENAESNARLISAAPELLELAKENLVHQIELHRHLRFDDDQIEQMPFIKRLRTVIAKAGG